MASDTNNPPMCKKWQHTLAKEISIETDFAVEDVKKVMHALVTVFTRRAVTLKIGEWMGLPGLFVFKKVMSPHRRERIQYCGFAQRKVTVPELLPHLKLRPRIAKALFNAVRDEAAP